LKSAFGFFLIYAKVLSLQDNNRKLSSLLRVEDFINTTTTTAAAAE
jgi:hypothetical protein